MLKLKIHNYGIIEDLEVELAPGLTTLSGQNGSGKSTFVDALHFALFGSPMDHRLCADLINWGAMDKKAVVRLECDAFTITRTIKPSGQSHKLECADGTVLTKSMDINTWIRDHYKLGPLVIPTDIFFSQQLKATELFDATAANRLSALSALMGVSHLEHLRSVIYRVLSETPLLSVNDELIRDLSVRVETARTELDALNGDLAVAQKTVDDLHFDQAAFEKVTKAPLDAERQFHIKALEELQKQYALDLKNTVELNKRAMVARDLLDDQNLWARIDMRSEFESRIRDLESGVSVESLRSAQKQANEEYFPLKAEVAKLQQQSTEELTTCPLTGGKPCIELLRLHDPQLIADELKQKQAKLTEMENDLSQLEMLIAMREKDAREVDSLRKKIADIGELGDPMLSKEDMEKGIAEFGEDLQGAIEAHRAAADALVHAEADINKEEKWLAAHPEGETVSEESKTKWAGYKMAYDKAMMDVTRINLEITTKQKALAADETTLRQMQADKEKVTEQNRRVDVVKDVRDLLSRDNLQRALMQGIMKRINREIEICSQIFNFKYKVFIAESGDIVFQEDGGEPRDVRYLSGGQKYTAAIITRIAFARVLRTNFVFMALDEPSICLDDDSRQLLAELLRALNERFKQEGKYLLVPTHDELITSQGRNINVQGD